MIIIDTDVLSAAIRDVPNERVVHWLDSQRFDEIWITSITTVEVLIGIEELPRGGRRDALERSFLSALTGFLRGRVLAFDHDSAFQAGRLYGQRRRAGRTIALADTQIAGIAVAHGATLATGNQRDFADLAVPVVNPWEA